MSDAFHFGLKVAEIMLPGAQAPRNGMDFSGFSAAPSLPPITGPLTDDLSPGAFSSALAKSMEPDSLTGANPNMRLTDAEIASGRDALPKPGLFSRLASGAKNFYEWGTTPIGATQYAKEHNLTHLPYAQQEQAWRKTQLPEVSPAEFRKEYEAALSDYFHKSQRNSSRNTPIDQWSRALLSPARLAYHGGRGVAAAADAASDLADGSWKNWELFAPVRKTYDNVDKGIESARKIVSGIEDANKPPTVSPEELAAAQAAPKPTMGNYLSDSLKRNPMWLLPAAGLGGLGVYGLYKALQARKDAKRRRRLMSPAAITY